MRRERRRQVDADEGGVGRLPAPRPWRRLRRRALLRRRGPPLRRHRRQRAAGHHHHSPGARTGAAALDRGEPVPRSRARAAGRHRPHGDAPARGRAAGARRPAGFAADAGRRARRRPAAAGGDRQGAGQARAAADPGRAHRQPQRHRQRRAPGPAARAQAPRHRVHPDLPQAQGSDARRRWPHGAARRALHPQPGLRHRPDLRGPHHPGDGRPRPVRALPAAHAGDRRAALRAARLARVPPGAGRARGGQGRRPDGAPRRDRRHRRADGRGPDRARDERVRPQLRPAHQRQRLDGRPRGRRVHRAQGDRRRPGLRDRGPQVAGTAAGRIDRRQHDAGQPAGSLARRRAGQGARAPGGAGLPSTPGHALRGRRPERRAPVRRQPAEGGAGQVAVLATAAADPGRAHARHRRRRQVRDLQPDRRPGRTGLRHPGDLVRDARAAGPVRPAVRDE